MKSSVLTKIFLIFQFIRTSDDLIGDKLNPDVTYFFVNLYQFMKSNFCENTDTGYITTALHCLSILERAVKEPRSRRIFLTEFDFLPVLTVMLKSFPNEKYTLLNLLLKMTYELKVIRYETYLNSLIEQLVSVIYDEEDNALTALCVLLNLCNYPGPSRKLLYESAKYSEFMRRAQQHGFFHFKLMMCLTELDERRKRYDKFLKSGIEPIEKALEQFNTAELRQIVGYLVDCELIGTNVVVKDETISSFLHAIQPHLQTNSNQMETDDSLIEKSRCASLIFKLLKFLLNLNVRNEELLNICKELVVNWIEDDVAGAPACEVLVKVIHIKKELFGLDQTQVLVQLQNNFTRRKELAIASIKLISIIVSVVPDTELIQINPEIFKELLESISQTKKNSHEDIELFVLALRLLQQMSSINIKTYYSTFILQIQSPRTAVLLSQAYELKSCDLLTALFALSSEKNFPTETVAQHLSNHDQFFDTIKSTPKFSTSLNSTSLIFEGKINSLLAKVDENSNNAALNEPLASEIISIYRLKIQLKADQIKSLQKQVEQLQDNIKEQRQQISILESQSDEMDALNENVMVRLEEARDINKTVESELNTTRGIVKTLHRDIEQKQNLLKEMQEDVERQKLTQQLELEQNRKKLEKAEEQMKLLEKHIEEYRLNMKNYEVALKNNENENKKVLKRVHEVEAENTRMQSLVKQMEQQLLDKDLKIKQYAEELQESEQMRQMVLSLMNKKQKK